jgi:hypothetical protein
MRVCLLIVSLVCRFQNRTGLQATHSSTRGWSQSRLQEEKRLQKVAKARENPIFAIANLQGKCINRTKAKMGKLEIIVCLSCTVGWRAQKTAPHERFNQTIFPLSNFLLRIRIFVSGGVRGWQ